MKYSIVVFFAMAFVFSGCHTKQVVDAHDHEESKVLYTVYTPGLELFAESGHFVAGESSEILAHFTTLSDFKPIKKCAVTVCLSAGGQEVRYTAENPVREGIYRFDLTPRSAGSGHIRFIVHNSTADSIVDISDIRVYPSEEEAGEGGGDQHDSSADEVVFTKEQSWKTDFATAYPEKKPIGQIIKTVARVEPAQGAEMVISAKTNGMVLFTETNLVEGMTVGKGQHLLTISGAGLAGENIAVRYAEAGNNLVKAESDYERVKLLSQEKIISEKELTGALNHYLNCKALYEDLKASFTASGQPVSSSITGFIRQVMVKNGQYVDAGDPLLVVSQDRTLMLTAGIQQKYLPLSDYIRSATVRSSVNNEVYSLEQLGGKIESVGRSINGNNFMLPVSMKINNTAGFIPGSLVEVWLKADPAGDALTVPVSALLEEQGVYYVYVQVTPELFVKREVKTGVADGREIQILNGVNENERIVTKGAVMVKLARASGTLDPHSGHVH